MQVNAINQRPAKPTLVARHLLGFASADFLCRAQITARAGVHGTNHLKTRRKFSTPGRARNSDGAGLKGLTQCLQRGAGKLGQFVHEQHAMVSQGNLARSRR